MFLFRAFLAFATLLVVGAIRPAEKTPLADNQKKGSPRAMATDNPTYSCSQCSSYTYTGSNCDSSCYSCGFGAGTTSASDCVACASGTDYLSAVYSDCTGACYSGSGPITNPVYSSSCNLPCAHCGFPYHPFVSTTTCDSTYCSSNSFTTGCFAGNTTYAACSRCGFGSSISAVSGANYCVTCPEGYEIDVVQTDCTGYCVPTGTAVKPISASTCKMPCTACGTTYDGFVGKLYFSSMFNN